MRCWHRLVAADGGYLRIAQASFHEPADSLVPQIVKAEILKARCLASGHALSNGYGRRMGFRLGAPKNASSVSGGRRGWQVTR